MDAVCVVVLLFVVHRCPDIDTKWSVSKRTSRSASLQKFEHLKHHLPDTDCHGNTQRSHCKSQWTGCRLQSQNGNFLCCEVYHSSKGNDMRDKLSNYPFVCGVAGCAATLTLEQQADGLYYIRVTGGNQFTATNRYLNAENWYGTDRLSGAIRLQSNYHRGCAAKFEFKHVSSGWYAITVRGGNVHTPLGGSTY